MGVLVQRRKRPIFCPHMTKIRRKSNICPLNGPALVETTVDVKPKTILFSLLGYHTLLVCFRLPFPPGNGEYSDFPLLFQAYFELLSAFGR